MQGGDMNTMKKCSTCGAVYAGDLCPQCMAGFAGRPTDPTQPPEELPLKPGQSFHGLEILELLGRGGMGIVYKARQPALDRLVALKILPHRMAQDPDFQSRFVREAKALGSLNHPNIVAVYDFGAEAGLYFFAMEYVDGTNLRQVLRNRTLDSAQALRIVPQLCDALEYAHTEGVVHRDIKPENILLDKKGRVKIADFGLAKLVGADAPANLTVTNMVMGTPHYMAPEQVENPKGVDHRADIYAIGVVFYEMLTGELPIGRFDLPSKKVQIDVRLDEVVLRALEKQPEKRWQKAGEVKDAVTKATTAAPSHESYQPTVITPKPARRSRLTLAAGVAAAVLVLAALALRLPVPQRAAAVAVSVPEAPPDLSALHFGPEERPAHYVFAPADKLLPRNPFPAKDAVDREQLCRILDDLGLQNVTAGELRQGYVCAWFRWTAAFIALDTDRAAKLEPAFHALPNLANKWTHRKGPLLVMAWSGRAETREVFHDLVARLQKKLGLPAVVPDVPLENLKFERGDLPSGWQLQEAGPAAKKAGLKEQVQASFEPVEGEGQIEVRAWLADSEAAAAAFEAAQLDFTERRRTEVWRAGRTVAGIALRGDGVGAFVKTAMRYRRAMGRPERRFEDLRPTADALPAGFTIEAEETRPGRILQDLGAQGVLVSETPRAVRVKLKPAGRITLMEAPDSAVRSKLEELFRKTGPGWGSDDWVFGIEGPDDETLDALENRMRELFGWDRNRPRPIGLFHAQLKESELPSGWTLGPAKADRWNSEGTLKGPAGELPYRIQDPRDYGVVKKKAAEFGAKPGDLVLVKDTVVCFVGGGEAAWPVLETLEPVLRKKMRMGAPTASDFELVPRELPSGTTITDRKDLGWSPNPQEATGTAAVKRLLEARLGADLGGARSAWAAATTPGETLVAVLEAPDAKALAARLKESKGARHLAVYAKGSFVGVLRSERTDGTEFEALRELLRAKLRASK
jgi:tRNA A-37 threonylcarbamoyl transferase component Bud32